MTGISVDLYRMRIGLFFVKASGGISKLGFMDTVFIIMYIATNNRIRALRIVLFLYIVMNQSLAINIHAKSKHYCDIETCDNDGANVDFFLNLLKQYLIFVLCILLHIGGVELNPGPTHTIADGDRTISSFNESSVSTICELFSNSISFLHLNIQSLVPKLDLIAAEYEEFDILSFSESWLNDNVSDDSIKLTNYQTPFRKDRGPNKLGGGVVVYIKDSIQANRRLDLESNNVEGVWLQIKTHRKNILFGAFYIPPIVIKIYGLN